MDAIREDVEQSGGGLIDSDDGVVSEKSKARVSGINDMCTARLTPIFL